ncbi:nucleoside hydrolase [Lichenicoccus sp.]|uniref:nucleoside hydrolase n=1 Tax=Lichenicoccus sp. TaxID=2781899 RepID=UPI003D0C7684
MHAAAWKHLLSALLCLTLAAFALPTRAATPMLVVEDNDFLGPGGSDLQSTLPLLADPAVQVLGFTVVVGDGWENAESAHLRRFLEIAGHADIPVVDGATLPLVNSVARMRLWEKAYGTIPWKGAWGGLGSIADIPATQPPVPRLDEGAPALKASTERAADFLIRTVHEHPHQVTIVAAGPLTNLALAVRLDPSFAADAKQLVFMGALIDTNMQAVTGNADFASDFNMIFDPEAAHIVLTAPWPKITSVGNVSDAVMMTRTLMARIGARHNALTQYLSRYYAPLPMWDELTAAVAADPYLVTKSVEAFLDIDTSPGINYGHAHVWPEALAPRAMGARRVTIVQAVDTKRFLDRFVQQAQDRQPQDRPAQNRAVPQ